ncbi:serine hydrolase [Candidatus Microgenomates bacterium]|nr:MAG: serine hydrolase [Candidatus Microgenomates bacterium]
MKQTIVALILAGITFVAGFFLSRQISTPRPAHIADDSDATCHHELINQRFCTEEEARTSKKALSNLRLKLIVYIDQKINEGELADAAVIYRDHDAGPTIFINQDETFTPASLLKVPIMMAVFKFAESDPRILLQKITITEDPGDQDQRLTEAETIQIGEEYTIEELVEKMIIHSDNRSLLILIDFLHGKMEVEDPVRDTLAQMGITLLTNTEDELAIRAKDDASILRLLYNVAYLNPEYSQKALEIMTKTTFTQGLVRGVPDETKIAHKYGISVEGADRQLHDCGIVYASDVHYSLCVMTKGHNEEILADIIADISKMIYEEVN